MTSVRLSDHIWYFGEPCLEWLPIRLRQRKRRHLLLEMFGVPEGLQVKQLISPLPDHNHPVHHAESTVHVAKRNLKRKASGGDQSIRRDYE